MKLFYKYIKGDSELLLSSLGECFYGILYVLNTFWCSCTGGKDDGYAFLTISFVSVQYDDTTFFLFTNVHDAKFETVGRLFVIK